MKNIYRNSRLANWNSLLKLEKNEVMRLGKYSLYQTSGRITVRKGKRIISEVKSLEDGLNILLELSNRSSNA